jgi:hypothetical protein
VAVIIFENDVRKSVRNTVDQIRHSMRSVRTPHVPLIMVVEQDGREVWINASRIREIYDTGVPQEKAAPPS